MRELFWYSKTDKRHPDDKKRRRAERRRQNDRHEHRDVDEGSIKAILNGSKLRLRMRDASAKPNRPPIAGVLSLVVALTLKCRNCPPYSSSSTSFLLCAAFSSPGLSFASGSSILRGTARHPGDDRKRYLLESTIQGLDAGSWIITRCWNAGVEALRRDNGIVFLVHKLDVNIYGGLGPASRRFDFEITNFNGKRQVARDAVLICQDRAKRSRIGESLDKPSLEKSRQAIAPDRAGEIGDTPIRAFYQDFFGVDGLDSDWRVNGQLYCAAAMSSLYGRRLQVVCGGRGAGQAKCAAAKHDRRRKGCYLTLKLHPIPQTGP